MYNFVAKNLNAFFCHGNLEICVWTWHDKEVGQPDEAVKDGPRKVWKSPWQRDQRPSAMHRKHETYLHCCFDQSPPTKKRWQRYIKFNEEFAGQDTEIKQGPTVEKKTGFAFGTPSTPVQIGVPCATGILLVCQEIIPGNSDFLRCNQRLHNHMAILIPGTFNHLENLKLR